MTKARSILFKLGLSIFVLTLFCLSSLFFVHAEELEGYELQFYDDVHFQLENGVYEVNTSWATTGKTIIKNDDVIPVLPYCHYIQLWNKMNVYMGYYIVDGTDNTLSSYLGIWNSGAITLPGIKSFALSINKDGVNTYPNSFYGSEVHTNTFFQIFGNPTYLNYTDSVLTDTLSNTMGNPTYLNYQDDILGGTLADVILNGSTLNDGLIADPYLSEDLDLDDLSDNLENYGDSVSSYVNSYQRFTILADDETQYISLNLATTDLSFIAGHKYYLELRVKVSDSQDQQNYRIAFIDRNVGDLVNGTQLTFNNNLLGEPIQEIYGITTADNTEDVDIAISDLGFTLADVWIELYYLNAWDLTSLYGTGNEPTALNFHNIISDYGTGDIYYGIDNLADTNNMLYADLLDYAETRHIPTYALTQVLPTNLITNPYMSIDDNVDGKADGWTVQPGVANLTGGVQSVYGVATGPVYTTISHGLTALTVSNSYYYSLTMTSNGTGSMQRSILLWSAQGTKSLYLDYNDPNTISNFFTADKAYINFETHFGCGNSITYFSTLDNVFFYNISALKTAGLFAGMSDAQIKTVLDDYAQNGLTSSNIGYFFTDGGGDFDDLTITDKNTILSYYGLSYAGGTVIDIPKFKTRFFVWQTGTSWNDVVIVEKKVQTFQDFYKFNETEVRDLIELSADVDLYTDGHNFETLYIIDKSNYDFSIWLSTLTQLQENYYTELFFDGQDNEERYEWYIDYGITSTNYAYYRQLYLDGVNEIERYEWYIWGGITSTNYPPLLDIYATLQTITPIIFTDFETNEVFYLTTPGEEPDDLAPTIDDTLTGIGVSPILKVVIGLAIIGALFIFIAIKRGNWLYYPLIGYPAFVVFALLGWFVWWLALLFTAILTLILYLVVFR